MLHDSTTSNSKFCHIQRYSICCIDDVYTALKCIKVHFVMLRKENAWNKDDCSLEIVAA